MGGSRYSPDVVTTARRVPLSAQQMELGFVKIRYKLPKSETSRLITTPIDRRSAFARFEDAPQDARFAVGVAAFADMLRGGRYSASFNYDDVLRIVSGAKGKDEFGYRSEFVQLVRAAKGSRSLASLGE